MGDVFTGTHTVALPSGHPGPLCRESTPAELRNKITASRQRKSSCSACQAHFSNMDSIDGGVDTCEGARYLNLEEVPHTNTHAHNSTL